MPRPARCQARMTGGERVSKTRGTSGRGKPSRMACLSRFLSACCGSACYLRLLSFVIDGMKRVILALLGLASAAGLMMVGMHEVRVAGPVYSVTELRPRLTHDPSA